MAELVVAVFIFALLLHKPGGLNQAKVIDTNEVSPYLTHVLSPQFYNGVQLEEPFELVVLEEGINDIIMRSRWPRESNGVMFSVPVVFFVPGKIKLMGTARIKGVEFAVTIVSKPGFDEDGLLNLAVDKVRIGAMNITVLARMMAKRMYAQRLAEVEIDTQDLRAQVAAALLDGEPFEPVFEIEDKKVRIEQVDISRGKLTIRFVPVSG